jgi:hypothetical protein
MAKDDTNSIRIVAVGRLRTVEYAVLNDGRMLAKEFIDGLHQRDQAWLFVRFQIIADQGERGISNEDIFRREREIPEDIKGTSGWLWAFKKETSKRPGCGKGLIRIPCFMVQDRWVLVTGFWKQLKPKWQESAYTDAFAIIREVMRREHRA